MPGFFYTVPLVRNHSRTSHTVSAFVFTLVVLRKKRITLWTLCVILGSAFVFVWLFISLSVWCLCFVLVAVHASV